MPLALTVGIATAGVAAWVWSERSDDDEDQEREPEHDEYRRDDDDETHDIFPARGLDGDEPPPYMADDAGMMARMHNTLRRTPSPQQIFDGASKRVAAGVAAAGAFVGGLTSIQEENRRDFEDHSRWSEEVESREQADAPTTMSGALPTRGVANAPPAFDKKKKTVAIVVSSVSSDSEDSSFQHAVGYNRFSVPIGAQIC